MSERGIIFSGPMVRAILADRKTVTRRLVRANTKRLAGARDLAAAQPMAGGLFVPSSGMVLSTASGGLSKAMQDTILHCPYGARGDRLWVRETWQTCTDPDDRDPDEVVYAADHDGEHPGFAEDGWSWRPSIYMPRWASRITLEIERTRVERLHAITDDDARAEGCAGGHDSIPGYRFSATPREHFEHLWREIHGGGANPWPANPWVWVVSFRLLSTRRKGVAA